MKSKPSRRSGPKIAGTSKISIFRAWLARLMRAFRRKGPPGRPWSWPTKEEIARLPLFEGLRPEHIIEIVTAGGGWRAHQEIIKESVVGFDTESKPVFVKGRSSDGPHTVQFSTPHCAYVFVLRDPEVLRAAGALIAKGSLKKVGFGLNDDLRQIREKLKVTPRGVLDVSTLFSKGGYGQGVGVKTGVAIVFKRQFHKPRKMSTSDWSRRTLSPHQLLYAANDAYAALRVYLALPEKLRTSPAGSLNQPKK